MRSGILLIDKPAGITSAHAIKKIEKRFRIEKIGHGGTLDPFATGLLVVLIGEGTKIARFLLADRKGYEAKAKIGWETETGDLEGARVGETDAPAVPESAWRESLPRFLGKTMQTPPKYSALKVKGRKLYEYARAGEEMTVPAREIEVFELALTEWTPTAVKLRLECAGGTYVRTLAEDWARAAGTAAHLEELRRYRVGDFTLARAPRLDDILELSSEAELPLVTIPEALAHFPQIHCGDLETARIRAGDQSQLVSLIAGSENSSAALASEHILLLTGEKNSPTALALLTRGESGFKLDRVFR